VPECDRRSIRPALLLLCACSAHPPIYLAPGPRDAAAVAGCHVILSARQRSGEPTGLLFPFYFELDTTGVLGTNSHVVRLSPDDLNRFAGTWRWRLEGDSLHVDAVAGNQAYHLTARLTGASWEGTLVATEKAPVAGWDVKGRKEACPRGWRTGRTGGRAEEWRVRPPCARVASQGAEQRRSEDVWPERTSGLTHGGPSLSPMESPLAH